MLTHGNSTEAAEATEPLPPPCDATEVRFSIRALLIVTAVIAVATTALGAFIRQFPPQARLRLAIYWGVFAAAMLVRIAYHDG